MYKIGIKVDSNITQSDCIVDTEYTDIEFETIEEAQDYIAELNLSTEDNDAAFQAASDFYEIAGFFVVLDEEGEEV